MQYNIFKIENRDSMLKAIMDKQFEIKGRELTSGNYNLKLYCKFEENQKINWKSIFDTFGEENIPNKSAVSSIILCSDKNNIFAITYGNSSFLAQKYCDREFGFDFAKRIELNEIKRKSSITTSSNKNSSITSYKNTKTVLYETGENITSISFTPIDKFYGRRIDIGKSIKFNIDLPLEKIYELLDSIKLVLNKAPINKIPLLIELKNEFEITECYNKMYNDFRNELEKYKIKNIENYNNINLNEFTIVGCDFYFENEDSRLIRVGKQEFEVKNLNFDELFKLSIEKNIDIQTIVEYAKIIYKNESNDIIFSEYLRNHINYEMSDNNICFYDGRWYEYNNDYVKLIHDEIRTIKVVYKDNDNIIENNLKKVGGLYREDKINKLLSNKYSGVLLDRDCLLMRYDSEFNHNNYKVEIADLIIDDTYFSVKIGNSQSLSYCVDQSLLAANLINFKLVDLKKVNNEKITNYGLWFYLIQKRIFNKFPLDLLNLNSIMLMSKLSIWSKQIKSMGKVPLIYISKYEI